MLDGSSTAPEDMASAYRVTDMLGPVSPTWTFTGDTSVTGVLGSFAHP